MVGVDFPNLHNVDLFNLLGLDPFAGGELKDFRRAWARVMKILHPDKGGDEVKTQQLNLFKEYLWGHDMGEIEQMSRFSELVRRGPKRWESTWNPWVDPQHPDFSRPIPAYTQRFALGRHDREANTIFRPGSSPSKLTTVRRLADGRQSRGKRHKAAKAGRDRRRRNKRPPTLDSRWYHPSRESKWRPAAYADESDVESVWEQDWDSEDDLLSN